MCTFYLHVRASATQVGRAQHRLLAAVGLAPRPVPPSSKRAPAHDGAPLPAAIPAPLTCPNEHADLQGEMLTTRHAGLPSAAGPVPGTVHTYAQGGTWMCGGD